MARIPESLNLFLAHFPDGGIYSTGPQGCIPGGPIAFEVEEMAQQVADAINGEVSTRCIVELIERCHELNYVLWICKADGRHSYIEETIPLVPNNSAIRVEGEERERLIRVAWQQTKVR